MTITIAALCQNALLEGLTRVGGIGQEHLTTISIFRLHWSDNLDVLPFNVIPFGIATEAASYVVDIS